MDFVPTTATAVEKLNLLAKKRRKASGMPLATALDTVAKEHGYDHWKHVTVCLQKTQSTGASAEPVVLTRFERVGHLMTDVERDLYPKMLPAEQEFLLFQIEKATPEGKARYQEVSTSITISSRDAKKMYSS
jgi:hypothetical protein